MTCAWWEVQAAQPPGRAAFYNLANLEERKLESLGCLFAVQAIP